MATYYIKASGSSTWPFDTEETAASNIDVLYAALTAHSTSLGIGDIVQVRGEIIVPDGVYDLNGALLTGIDSRSDRLVLSDAYFMGGLIRNLNIAIIQPDGYYSGGGIYEYENCRIGYENPGVSGSFIEFVGIELCGSQNVNITNNLFYCTNKQEGDFVSVGIIDIYAATPANITIENNTFADCDGWQITFSLVAYLDKFYFRNNASNGGYDIFDISGLGIISDLQHKNNDYVGHPKNASGDPITLNISEVVADPLFVGSGDEPYRLGSTSPARHTGVIFAESPATDLVGTTRPNPPSMGALEDAPAREPGIYYVNSGSSTQDGLTPETGYHSCCELQRDIPSIAGDTIRFVDSGEIIETGNVYFNDSITLEKYSGSANKPTWRLLGDTISAYGISFYGVDALISIHDIVFTTNIATSILIDSLVNTDDLDINGCEFIKMRIYIYEAPAV